MECKHISTAGVVVEGKYDICLTMSGSHTGRPIRSWHPNLCLWLTVTGCKDIGLHVLTPTRLELVTYCVLGSRDSQLHYGVMLIPVLHRETASGSNKSS
jgi:hypothetical protein